MTIEERMETDWVVERSKCSVVVVFEKLKLGVEHDTDIRHQIPGEEYGFRFVATASSFSVTASGLGLHHTVGFAIRGKVIEVSMDGEAFLEGAVTLSDDGVCRISVKGKELELWQFRRRALEQLFFGF